MKRAGNLYDRIAEPENLRLAFVKSIRGKRGKPDVVAYGKRLDENLSLLRDQLLSRQVDVGHYHFFTVHDPKERVICAASFSERVLHHAIMNVCEPVLERYAVFDSYACRTDKGMHAAVQRAEAFGRQHPWYLISQHLANFYLGHLDHWIKETLRVPAYVRYMDDCVLWGADRSVLKGHLVAIRGFLETELRLSLKDNVQLNRRERGLPFLGYRIFPRRIALGPRARRRFAHKLVGYEHEWQRGVWSESDLARHMEALLSYVRFADSAGLRRKIVSELSVAA